MKCRSIVRPSFSHRFSIASAFAALAFYAYGGCASASPIVTPPTPERPIVVHVGLAIRNLAAIDDVKESWQVTGLLIAKWKDLRLRYRPNGREHYHDLPDSAWKPSFEFANEITPTNFGFVDLYAQPDGTVVYTETFNASLSTSLDLRRFPFDSQLLPLVVQARGDDLDSTILKTDPADSPLPNRAYAGLAQWIPLALTERLGTVAGSASRASDVEFALKVRRNPKSYIWKFIVPLLLLVIISWVTFWLSHEEFKTKDQLQSAVSTLLIVVAFNITASSVLPRTEYVTYIDALLFTCFAFVVISIGTIVMTHLLQINHSVERALPVRRFAGLVLPVAFLIAQVALFLAFHIAG
jgi:Neurotransmitter-gated ion-channel ligand binding domain/Neurotransmitter-gated ion-channel transmembrane region